ncbi:MAG: DUF1801 domain-containing protein [Gemmatimonadetes bacterium]|nr:DUF1801 domain-containing protein [Gemmatimonadota bacterium]
MEDQGVAAVFAERGPKVRSRLLELRELILDTAAATKGVGDILETLKWGEPAYLTHRTKSGSTIRLGVVKSDPDEYALHFNCQTDLVERFRAWFGEELRFDGNRSILLRVAEPIPTESLRTCIAAALTYHRDKRARRPTRTP